MALMEAKYEYRTLATLEEGNKQDFSQNVEPPSSNVVFVSFPDCIRKLQHATWADHVRNGHHGHFVYYLPLLPYWFHWDVAVSQFHLAFPQLLTAMFLSRVSIFVIEYR